MISLTGSKVRVELPLSVDSDIRRHRLQELLSEQNGISLLHAMDRPGQNLCVHFDPAQVTVEDVRKWVRAAAGTIDRDIGRFRASRAAFTPREARNLADRLQGIPGVLEASVSAQGAILLEFDRHLASESSIAHALLQIDRSTQPADAATAQESHGHDHGHNAEILFVAICGISLFAAWLLDLPAIFDSILLLIAYFFGSYFALLDTARSVRLGRLEIDALMLVAAAGAAALGRWEEGALLLFLFSLGHSLEAYAMGRAKRAILALARLVPDTATVRRGEELGEVPVSELRLGDTVIVRPGSRVPADGIVISGHTSVNQAPITGESMPVDKKPVSDQESPLAEMDAVDQESRIFAGTINGNGAIEIRVGRVASESTMARIVRAVEEARTDRSPTQRFTDRFERWFVPATLLSALVLLLAWVVIDESFSESFYRAMAFLVAASPCALAIATPSAVLSGIARSARAGVLIKSGSALETLGQCRTIAFDKTGTLTTGRPELSDVIAFDDCPEQTLLEIAVAVERHSSHPLAEAIVQGARDRLGHHLSSESAEAVESIPGLGIRALVRGKITLLGSADLFDEVPGLPVPETLRAYVENLERAGRTTAVLRHGDVFLGVLGIMDTPREEAAQVVNRLRRIGVERMVLLSGDNQRVADAVATKVGIDAAQGGLMPDEKVDALGPLRPFGPIAMVGDGVNDAPVLAGASVGIAMGAMGSDAALEAADVALMANELTRLPFAVELSRATAGVIRQNLRVSLAVVAILIPATLLGLGIGPAVALHEGSTVVVVLNALRLLAFDTVVR